MPAAAFNIYKGRTLLATPPSSSSILSQYSLARFAWSHHTPSTPPYLDPPSMPPFVGLAVADDPGGHAELKLESSIYHSSFDAPE
jgi:hypothetical protein